VLIAGAGMAGLCAAARARQLGVEATVLEEGDRPGGSMLLSSGVVWGYRTLKDFRRECPTGDEALQRLIVERLDDALAWLESLGVRALAKRTRNPLTTGWRFDPRALTKTLVGAAADVQLGRGLVPGTGTRPLVLATGGFPRRLARLLGLPLRANPWSDGAGFDFARELGAAPTTGMDEFYGRAMPAPPARWGEAEFVDHAQLYGRFARVVDENGDEIVVDPADWAENRLVQEIARRGGTAWYVVPASELQRPTPYGTIAQAIERARLVGGTVEERDDGSTAVHVAAAVTHTIGGLAIDDHVRVLDESGAAIEGVYAAGVDAGGWSTGGYASGLAAALVFGLTAADEIAS
jgi:succinate dehydrogenase/fumarate reductase flavoprotein subunit